MTPTLSSILNLEVDDSIQNNSQQISQARFELSLNLIPGNKPCKCGSTLHRRTSHSSCKLNKSTKIVNLDDENDAIENGLEFQPINDNTQTL